MKAQQGLLAATLVALAVGLAVTVLMVSIWIADAGRRAHEIEGRLETADLDAATRYLPSLFVPARQIEAVDRAAIRRLIGPSQIDIQSAQGVRLIQPFLTTVLYVGQSQNQSKQALWVFQERFGDQTQHALIDASGDLSTTVDPHRLCFSLTDPVWIYCHARLPGQMIDG